MPVLTLPGEHDRAVEVLSCYFGLGRHAAHRFTGARFDTWDSLGTKADSADVFTADDVVAVSFLSVHVPGRAAADLLDGRRAEFSGLLCELGPDRDLVAEVEPWPDDWVGWRVWSALRSLPDVGPTTASKLFARKRPRLRPIYDSVVEKVIGGPNIWEPLRLALQADPTLHLRLEAIREEAGALADVSAIRVFDVLAWMQGSGHLDCGAN